MRFGCFLLEGSSMQDPDFLWKRYNRWRIQNLRWKFVPDFDDHDEKESFWIPLNPSFGTLHTSWQPCSCYRTVAVWRHLGSKLDHANESVWKLWSYLHAYACGQMLVARAFSRTPHTWVCQFVARFCTFSSMLISFCEDAVSRMLCRVV